MYSKPMREFSLWKVFAPRAGERYSPINLSFSVDNANLADSLMRLSGRHVELKYNEYLGALPWRGYSNFIVEEILSVK